MRVTFEDRNFNVFQKDGKWYAIEIKYDARKRQNIFYNDMWRYEGNTRDETVEKVIAYCRYDKLVKSGVRPTRAAAIVFFGASESA